MKNVSNRIEWLDSLRAVAILAVIVIHISSPLLNVTFNKDMGYWWIANVLDSAVRFAVPLFLMISGATLLSRQYKLKDFYKKRFLRVVLPLLFYMLVYYVFRWFSLPSTMQPLGSLNTLSWAGDLFLNEGISKHLWFVYMIIILYLFTPALGAFIRKLKPEMMVFLLAAWVLMCNISQGFSVDIYSWRAEDLLGKLYMYFLYIGYMVLGYYFYNIFYVSKNIRLTASILYLITVVVAVLVVYYTSHQKSKLDLAFYNYLNLNTIIQASAVFIAFKHTSIRSGWVRKALQTIGDYSYGIYFVYILLLGIFYNVGIFCTMTHPLLSLPVLLILTLAVSIVLIWILRKIPYGKYISG